MAAVTEVPPPPEGEVLWYASDWYDESAGAPGLAIYRDSRCALRARFSDDVQFLIDPAGRRVVGYAPAGTSAADVACYLTGPVVGILLRLRGAVALHASAVQIGDRAVALVGDARAGKSTTAAVLARMGHKVIAEDVAALSIHDRRVSVHAACAEVALRPDAAALLYGSSDALPAFSETWDKRRLDLLSLGAFAAATVPLKAVYMLANTEGIPDAPCLEPMPARQALLELLANSYGNRLFHEELRLRELDAMHRLASTVPVKAGFTGGRLALVSRFCELVVEDVARQ